MKNNIKPLVCLQIHNDYQVPGGETKTAELIAGLLEEFGIRIIKYYKSNNSFSNGSTLDMVKIGLHAVSNSSTEIEINKILDENQVDFALIHNTSPIISNSIYKVLFNRKIPIIKYLQNYNLVCLNGALDHEEKCKVCRINSFIGVKQACYKGSRAHSYIKYMVKRDMDRKYINSISAFMPNSEFVRDKHVEYGLDKNKMTVMYNYIDRNQLYFENSYNRESYLYFGRISKEKGIFTVLKAFEQLPELNLTIMGSGELENELIKYIKEHKLNNIQFIGRRNGEELEREISKAKCVIVSSEWDEPFPRTILEAYSQGTPVIGTNRGGIPEMILEEKTGFIYESGDVKSLIHAIGKFDGFTEQQHVKMRENCLDEILKSYTKEKYYERFMKCLRRII